MVVGGVIFVGSVEEKVCQWVKYVLNVGEPVLEDGDIVDVVGRWSG